MGEEAEVGLKAYIKFILHDKGALTALAIIILFIGVAVYVSTWPSSVAFNYLNKLQYWESRYPTTAAPSWMAALDPSAYAPSITVTPVSAKLLGVAGQTYIYNLTYRFSWRYGVTPTDVDFIFGANTTIGQIYMSWRKPSGELINMSTTVGTPSASFDLLQFSSALSSYIFQRTGITLVTESTQALAQALFNNLSGGKVGPVERGMYYVSVYVTTSGPARFTSAEVRVLGNSYGVMGTDYYGRPIFLGILLGLPNALEIGLLTAILSVLIGAFVGGFSGYLGGGADSAINWFSTVILALPALPFLVALGLMLRHGLSLLLEALLITFLSWPFYAIIARSAAQSIRTNAFVEADRLMGIPRFTTFTTHFLPRLVPFIVAYTVLGIPGGILLVETLAFIGIAPPNLVTWGGMLDAAYDYNAALNGWWWWIVFPGLMIVAVALPFVWLGFAIERAAFGGR